MNRFTAFCLVALAAAAAATPVAAEPHLRQRVTVEGPLVTLGDLFSGAGAAAGTAVFQSPDPGTTGQVSASRILAAAAAHGLSDVAYDTAKVSVTRASRIVVEDEIRHAIAEAAAEEVAPGTGLEVEIDRLDEALHIEPDALAPLAVDRLDFDPATGRFSAVVSVADSQTLASGLRVTGAARQMVELPVLVRAVRRGETIATSDVALLRLPLSRAPEDAALDLADIVGKSARSSLRADTPVPADRLMEPILVARNDVVIIVYRAGGLTLTVRGRALGEGARGDLVTVMNSQSNRTIEAVVAGPGQVVVEPPRELTARIASK